MLQRFSYGWQQREVATDQPSSPSDAARLLVSKAIGTTESGGSPDYESGKKVKGRKRHIPTNASWLLVAATVHSADLQNPTALRLSWPRSGAPSRRGKSSPMADVPAPSLPWQRPRSAAGGCRSSASPISLEGSRFGLDAQRSLAWLNRSGRLARTPRRLPKSPLLGCDLQVCGT